MEKQTDKQTDGRIFAIHMVGKRDRRTDGRTLRYIKSLVFKTS